MSRYFFIYNLEKGKVEKEKENNNLFGSWNKYCIRYYKTDNGNMIEIGDGYRHEVFIDGKYWNRILNIIKNGELDKKGIKAVLSLMSNGLREKYQMEFIKAVKNGILKKI